MATDARKPSGAYVDAGQSFFPVPKFQTPKPLRPEAGKSPAENLKTARAYSSWAFETLKERPDDLNMKFFSPANIEYLQTRIVDDVRQLTGKTIDRQSYRELTTIMKGLYTAYKNTATLDKLNNGVLRVCVQQCVEGIQQFSTYVRDSSTMAKPLARPVNVSIKGRNTLGSWL